MPIPAIVAALLPVLTQAVPELVKLIKPGSESAQQNAAVASKVFEVAQQALGATNAQQVAEQMQSDPKAAQIVRDAVREQWYTLAEAGGGIEAARAADLAFVQSHEPVWRSPSFLVAVALLPLVYMVVGAIVGLFGQPFSEDVRAAIANGIVGLILGGLIGYYYGQTTTRNRTPAA